MLVLLGACNRKHGDAYKMEQVVATKARACATMKDGAVRCWGRQGETHITTPTIVPGLTNAARVCVGTSFTCARTRDSHIACVGLAAPSIVASDLACGDEFACAITQGKVVCWGEGTPVHDHVGTEGATSISAGGGTACAILAEGTAKCWGRGTEGQLGNGRFEDIETAELVRALGIKSISVGATHTCAILHDETVVCFGSDDDGELGDGHAEKRAMPAPVAGIDIAVEVAAGAHHTCARMGDSTVHCWGKNDVHQAGVANTPNIPRPTLVPGLYESQSVIAGDDFTCVRMTDGWLRCFGVNDWGQLADGTTDVRNVPTPIRY